MTTPTPHGLILFAHGARDPAWARPFEAIAADVRAQATGVDVALAYLELMTPDLPTAAAGLIARGCSRVTIVPMFLGAGGHVKRDLPALVEALRATHPGVRFDCTSAIGESPEVTRAIAAATLGMVLARG